MMLSAAQRIRRQWRAFFIPSATDDTTTSSPANDEASQPVNTAAAADHDATKESTIQLPSTDAAPQECCDVASTRAVFIGPVDGDSISLAEVRRRRRARIKEATTAGASAAKRNSSSTTSLERRTSTRTALPIDQYGYDEKTVSKEVTPTKKSTGKRRQNNNSNTTTMQLRPREKEVATKKNQAAATSRKRRKAQSVDNASQHSYNRIPNKRKSGMHSRPRCSRQGCNNQVQQGGLCIRHGAKVKQCTKQGCTKLAQQGGLCIKHGARVALCSWGDCNKLAQKGGVCYAHGAVATKCSWEGCKNNAKRRGLCKRHGAYRDL